MRDELLSFVDDFLFVEVGLLKCDFLLASRDVHLAKHALHCFFAYLPSTNTESVGFSVYKPDLVSVETTAQCKQQQAMARQ